MSPDQRTRRLVSRVLLVTAGLTLGWAALLFITGGFDVTLSGARISSHSPMRPLLVGAVMAGLFMLTGGDELVMRWVRRAAPLGPWLARLERTGRLDRAGIAVMVVAAVVFGVIYGSKVSGGSDAYGYVSEAELFLSGHISVPQPWVKEVPWPDSRWSFAPLGYSPTRGVRFTVRGYHPPAVGEWDIVPAYSPGMPLLMAAAKFAAGNAAMFWIVPLGGAVLLLATYGLGCRLGSRRLGLTAAFLVATAPTFLEYHFVTMTEVPIAAAWAVVCWCLLSDNMRSAVGGAVAMAVAVLIRPNLVPLGIVVALGLALRVWFGAPRRRHHVLRAAIFLTGFAAASLTTAILFWRMYGTPFESGYGPSSYLFSTSFIRPNIASYHHQLMEALTPLAYLGVAALFVPVRRLWPGASHRYLLPLFGVLCLVIWAEFCMYLSSDAALRFLLPCFPVIMLGLSSLALMVARSRVRGATVLATAAVLAFGGYNFARMERAGVLQQWQEIFYAGVAEQVAHRTPPNSVVIAMQHSGSIRYYAGRVTMRWDNLPADWLDRSVAWLGERGVHTYALIDGWERPAIRKRFAGQALAKVLEKPPLFSYGDTHFYDLGLAPDAVVKTEIIPMQLKKMYSPPPKPLPALEWK